MTISFLIKVLWYWKQHIELKYLYSEARATSSLSYMQQVWLDPFTH